MAILLQCIADTYLEQEYPDLNNGSATSLGCRNWAGYNWYSEILMKFQQLTPGTYSKIYLYVNQRDRDGFYNILHWNKMNSSWDEMTATYGNTSRNYTSISVPQVIRDGEWVTYDLTAHYSYLVGNNNGFALTPGSSTDIWIDSRESDNPPYIVAYTANDIMPPYNLQPKEDKIGSATLSWSFDGTESDYEIQYKQGSDDWITTKNKTLDSSLLNTGTVYWKVRVKSGSTWSPWSVEGSFSFTKVVLGAPTNLLPTTNQQQDVTILWENVQGDNPSSQTAYEVQWSFNQINWNTIPGTGPATQHTIPMGTFQFEEDSTTIYYRVRVKNNYGAWSEWSSSSSFLYYSSNPKKPTNLNLVQNAGAINATWTYVPNDEENQSGADVEYSFDNQNWSTLSHSGSTTAYTIAESYLNSTAVTQRTVYVRIRTKNALGGVSVYSDTKQISYKTSKPTAPADLQPFGQQIQGIVTGTWTFNSTGRGDTQKAFELMYKCEGQNWVTVSGTTASEYTFENLTAGTVLWKVRVQSSLNVWSDWSAEASFIYAVPPAKPTMTSLNEFDISKPTITWESQGQTSFRLQVLKDTEVYFDTQEVASSATSYTLEKALENDSTYVIKLRIKNRFALWSEWAEQSISTSFREPNQPSFSLLSNSQRASIHLSVSNPIPEEISKNEVFRRRFDEVEWTLLGEVEVNGSFVDYTLTSDTQYEYKVRAITEDGGYKDSEVQNIAVKVRNTQLANTQNYEEWVELKYNPGKSYTHSYNKKLVHYAGRSKPAVIRGQEETWRMNLSFAILEIEVLEKLLDVVGTQEILLLRDSRGKNKYVFVTSEPQITEQNMPRMWEVSFEVTEVDFDD